MSNIDFKRGDGGAGRLILRFSGDGAAPDLRKRGSSVVIDVGNASLPASSAEAAGRHRLATPSSASTPTAPAAGPRSCSDTKGTFGSLTYQTGRDYIVESCPARPNPRAPFAPPCDRRDRLSHHDRAYSGRPVTFNFQDVPVRAALQLIAAGSDLNIVASDTVSGNVTLRLINVPWDQALDVVLRAKGLDKRK